MSNINEVFSHGKAFIPFITAGDPNIETTEKLILAMEKAGADLIEIGIPFSDPVAEGVVIQEASLRALNGGVTTDKIFDMVRNIRKVSKVHLAFMTYINLVFTYGVEKFLSVCKELDIDALILPDLPFEEKDEVLAECQKNNVALISLIAPTSNERTAMIAKEAEGFVYCVSSMGVTGVRSEIKTNVGEMVNLVKQIKNIPCAIGFGISTPEQAKKMAQYADGVIVGSAVVKIIAQYGVNSEKYVYDFVKSMKDAIK